MIEQGSTDSEAPTATLYVDGAVREVRSGVLTSVIISDPLGDDPWVPSFDSCNWWEWSVGEGASVVAGSPGHAPGPNVANVTFANAALFSRDIAWLVAYDGFLLPPTSPPPAASASSGAPAAAAAATATIILLFGVAAVWLRRRRSMGDVGGPSNELLARGGARFRSTFAASRTLDLDLDLAQNVNQVPRRALKVKGELVAGVLKVHRRGQGTEALVANPLFEPGGGTAPDALGSGRVAHLARSAPTMEDAVALMAEAHLLMALSAPGMLRPVAIAANSLPAFVLFEAEAPMPLQQHLRELRVADGDGSLHSASMLDACHKLFSAVAFLESRQASPRRCCPPHADSPTLQHR